MSYLKYSPLMKDDNYIKRALSALTDYAVHMYSVADVDLQIKQKNVRKLPLLLAELLLMWHTY
jgi:hypothetical protein